MPVGHSPSCAGWMILRPLSVAARPAQMRDLQSPPPCFEIRPSLPLSRLRILLRWRQNRSRLISTDIVTSSRDGQKNQTISPTESVVSWALLRINIGGLLFGLYHSWQLYGFVTVFLLGAALAYVVWWKRDIRLSISLHVIANALTRVIFLMAALAM